MTDEPRSMSAPPIHPLAAFAIIALDGIFGTIEILDPFLMVFTCVGIGVLGCATTAMVQRFLAKDDWGAAIAKGLVMGIIAGVPYPIAGTVVGVPLLIWAGIHRSNSQPLLDNPDEK